jgi:hypothetical protein
MAISAVATVTSLAGLEIDVVEPDRERRDALDVLRHAIDHGLRALLVEREQDGIHRLGGFQHLVDGDLRVVSVRDHIIGFPRAGHDGIRQRPGDQDLLFCHGSYVLPGSSTLV